MRVVAILFMYVFLDSPWQKSIPFFYVSTSYP